MRVLAGLPLRVLARGLLASSLLASSLLASSLLASSLLAQDEIKRPRILGVAHVALYVRDLAKSRMFYEDFLGFDEEPFTLKKKDGSERIVFIKINDDQYLELFAEDPRSDDRLNHVSIYTDNADQMREYLAVKGVTVPARVGKSQTGNKNFNIKDPDDHTVGIVEYQPESLTRREAGKHMPATRISERVLHAGFLVGDLGKSVTFYGGILGLNEFWRGSSSGRTLSWVNMRVPDGDDYVEFMLYGKPPAPEERGSKDHVSLVVPDARKAVEELRRRATRDLYEKQIPIQIGKNRRRQINLFDPDGTRIELMEPNTVDGNPAPSSTAPPPRPGEDQAPVPPAAPEQPGALVKSASR